MNSQTIILIFILGTALTKAKECSFTNFDKLQKTPIFFQKVGTEILLLPIGTSVKFDDDITAYCPSGFRTIDFSEYNRYSDRYGDSKSFGSDDQEMILTCINGETNLKYEAKGSSGRPRDVTIKYVPVKIEIACAGTALTEIYEVEHNDTRCSGKSYFFGINVKGNTIHFADSCFDLIEMKLRYIHYVTGFRSSVLSSQVNSSSIRIQDNSVKVSLPTTSLFVPETTITSELKKILGWQSNLTEFQYANFFPSNLTMPYFRNPLEAAEQLQRFLGWKNFVRGNWQNFDKLLKTRSETVSYDVYMGTSGITETPVYNDCNQDIFKELTVRDFNKKESVPKYVWTYLKSKNLEQNEEFVIVGINSPYFEILPKNETIFCKDMFDSISWLAPMKTFRKISSFGYMFSCKKDDAAPYLDGFPIFNTKTGNGESSKENNIFNV